MRLAILATTLFCGQVFASPNTANIYVANSTISHAPPRTTFALIEKNGKVWAAVDWYNRTASAINGSIKLKTGDGYGDEFMPEHTALKIKTKIEEWSIRFTFSLDVPPYTPIYPYHMYWTGPGPGGKPGSFDFDLHKQPPEPMAFGDTTLTADGFTMTATNNKTTGSFNNCMFTGNLKDDVIFKRVSITVKNNCYAPDNVTEISKGTKLDGVLFASIRPGVSWTGGNETGVYVLIMKAKTNKGYVGFSHVFPY